MSILSSDFYWFTSFSGIIPLIVDNLFWFKNSFVSFKKSSTCFIVLKITNTGLFSDVISTISRAIVKNNWNVYSGLSLLIIGTFEGRFLGTLNKLIL